MHALSEQERRRLATEWLESRLGQAEFCRQNGSISPRSLRSWVSRYCREAASRQPPIEQVQGIIDGAIRQLQAVAAAVAAGKAPDAATTAGGLAQPIDGDITEDASHPTAGEAPIPLAKVEGADAGESPGTGARRIRRGSFYEAFRD
jgi:transposase-like protein